MRPRNPLYVMAKPPPDVAARILGSNQYVDFLISGSSQAVAGVSASDMPSGGTVTLVGSLSYAKA